MTYYDAAVLSCRAADLREEVMVTTTTIGRNLKRIRTDRGLSQHALADRSGVPQPTISNIEIGRRDPHQSTLRKIAEGLEIDVVEFFVEEGAPKGPPPEPRTPLTLAPEAVYGRRLSKADTESKARALHKAMLAERDALDVWRAGLESFGAEQATLDEAARRQRTALKRWRAAIQLWTDFATQGDPERMGRADRAGEAV